MDIILDLDLGEDEQMQSHSLGDIENHEEQLHSAENMEVTQAQPKQHEEIKEQGSDRQEPVAFHLPVKVAANS